MIATVYVLAATEFVVKVYNYWAILGLDITLVILWLIAFSLTASNSSNYDHYYDDSYYFDDVYYYYNNSSTYRNVLRVCAIFGAFEL